MYAFDFPDNRTGYNNIASALKPQKAIQQPVGMEHGLYLRAPIIHLMINIYSPYRTCRWIIQIFTGQTIRIFHRPQPSHGEFPTKDFMRDVEAINDMKFRVSYGVIGNQLHSSLSAHYHLYGPYGEGVFNTGAGSEVYTGQEPVSYANDKLNGNRQNSSISVVDTFL